MATVVEHAPTYTGEPPELVLGSPGIQAIGIFLFMGLLSAAVALHQTFAWFNDEHRIDEFTIILMWFSCAGFMSIVLGNTLTQRKLVVTPKGFAYVVGKSVRACRWADVAEVRRYLFRVEEYDLPRATYWVTDTQGREFKFHDFRLDHTDCFGEWFLIPRIRERLLESALAKFDAGEEAVFGPFGISEAGLRYKAHRLEWNEIENIELDLDGDVVVRKRGRTFAWAEPGGKAVPNLFVMLELVWMRLRNRVLVKNTLMDWWNQLPQPNWHRDFGGVTVPCRDRPWLQGRAKM
jgi:hypothetical protein